MIQCAHFSFPALGRVRCLFTTREGGASTGDFAQGNLSLEVGDSTDAVMANREALQKEYGFTGWLELVQVHGQDILVEPQGDFLTGPTLRGDGLCTQKPLQALVVKTADCQPILLADSRGRYIAALHCGWRGNVAGFPALGVARFCRTYGIEPAQVLAVRGPSLGPEKSEFTNFASHWGKKFFPWYNPGHQTINLWELTKDQLRQAGLLPEHIFSLDVCTVSSPRFFSYRCQHRTGRQAGIIWLEK